MVHRTRTYSVRVTGSNNGRGSRHRGGRTGQALREDEGAVRVRPGGAGRHGLRAARAERRGQDHRRPRLRHAPAPGRGPGAGAGPRRGDGGGRGAAADRPDRAVRGAGRVPHRPRQPDHDRPAQPAHRERGPASRRRDARAVQPDRGRQPRGQDLLGRHAAAAGPGRQPDRLPVGAVPGRADHRPGPERPRHDLGDRPGARGRGDDAPAHHAVPGRGRSAGPPGGGDRRRHGHRRGHARRAQVLRRGRAPRGRPGRGRGRRGGDRRGQAVRDGQRPAGRGRAAPVGAGGGGRGADHAGGPRARRRRSPGQRRDDSARLAR